MAWEIVGETGFNKNGNSSAHLPVMLSEVLLWLRPRSGGVYVDCTVGYCGHGMEILRASQPNGILLGIDRDGQAINANRQRLQSFGNRAILIKAHFMELRSILAERRIARVDGVLFDLGVSSAQLDEPSRGFSFQSEGPLDMRMDQSSGPTAADIVNGLSEADLADMIYRWGEERYSRRIARAVARARQQQPLTTTRQLTSVIESAVPGHYRRGRIHCATRTFQALRIAVNRELEYLETSLRDAADSLSTGARLCVISFHSLEDRIVKQTFKALSSEAGGDLEILTKRPQVPSEEEKESNPRSRSAKLRVMQRVDKEGRT
ncbi:MAG TPA: 16S rRNA (cytosine(1402)-N(4))-methyltransferase RsmH [Nitrospira sp.]|nr:16S rRNA (cytosine(1402)-N(4))-methyltransferase RsmH [Nitrospira sp.]